MLGQFCRCIGLWWALRLPTVKVRMLREVFEPPKVTQDSKWWDQDCIPGHPSAFPGRWGCLLWSLIAAGSVPADTQSPALRLLGPWASLASSFCPFKTHLEPPANHSPRRQDRQQKRPMYGKHPQTPLFVSNSCWSLNHATIDSPTLHGL